MQIEEIIDNFSVLDEWEDRYRYLIELGRGLEPLADVVKSVEVGGVARVIQRVPLATQHVSAVAAMHIAKDARSPVLRWGLCELDGTEFQALPPVHLHHARITKITHQVANISRNDNHRPLA